MGQSYQEIIIIDYLIKKLLISKLCLFEPSGFNSDASKKPELAGNWPNWQSLAGSLFWLENRHCFACSLLFSGFSRCDRLKERTPKMAAQHVSLGEVEHWASL